MAKKKRIKRKSKTANQSKSKKNAFINFLKSERTQFLVGVIVAFIGLFIFLSMISFLFTGGADQSKVINKTYTEIVKDPAITIDNWTGAGGAIIAETMINN